MKNLLPKLIILALSFSVISQNSLAVFKDVDINTDYQKAIIWMRNNEVINGYEDNSFKPKKCVNRAEFLKMLYKILKVDTSTSQTDLFKDTPAKAWYAEYIRTARERKIIQGYKDGRFRPEQCVRRAEAIKMALLEFNNGQEPPSELNDDENYPIPEFLFNDVKTDDWFYNYLTYANTINTLGTKHVKLANEKFKLYDYFPNESMSRAEVAELLFRLKTIKDLDLKTYQEGYTPYALVTKPAEVYLKLDKVILTSGNGSNAEDIIDFDVYIERLDIGLKEDFEDKRASGLTVDLVPELQPKLMYISDINDTDPDTGSMCDRPRYPHRCTVTIKGDAKKESSHEYLIKITFEDDNNSYVATKFTVPHPTGINQPQITYLTQAPAQKSTLNMKFKDVGATNYEVEVNNCDEYDNDGINPCLNGVTYLLERKEANGPLSFKQKYINNPTVEIKNNIVEIKSDFILEYEEGVSYYVTAKNKWISKDGVEYNLHNSDTKYLTN